MDIMEIEINGLQHRIHTWGQSDKPKLFLFHGWMDMGASFDFVCRQLQEHYYCIAPDLRGMGHTEHTPSALGYFFYEYIADAHTLFESLAPGETLKLIGHSMGGNILSLYAGSFPERISHFTNIEGFGIKDMPASEGPERIRRWIETMEAHAFRIYPDIESVAARLRKTNPRLPLDRALFLAQHITSQTSEGLQIAADPRHKWLHPYLFQLNNIYPFWERITAQCLLVTGQLSRFGASMYQGDNLEEEIEQRLKHFPSSAKHIVIKDAGHMIHHEQPDALAQAILSFLEQH